MQVSRSSCSRRAPTHWSVRVAVGLQDPKAAIANETRVALSMQHDAGHARPVAMIWSCRPCLVVSSRDQQRLVFAGASRRLRDRGWPVLARASGGAVVPQGPGILNLTLVWLVPAECSPSITEHFRRLCAVIQTALWSLGVECESGSVPGSFCDGRFNIVVAGRKLGGTAQRWIPGSHGHRPAIIAHAVLLAEPLGWEAIEAITCYQSLAGAGERFDPSTSISLAEVLQSGSHSPVRDSALEALTRALVESCSALPPP